MAISPESQGQTLPGGKLSSGREGAQRTEDQLHLLAEEEGLKGSCPRISVPSVTHVLSCVDPPQRHPG